MARTYRLSPKERDDGSLYYTCPELPGFHYIVAPGEELAATLVPAFKEYLALAVSTAKLTLHPAQPEKTSARALVAELEVA